MQPQQQETKDNMLLPETHLPFKAGGVDNWLTAHLMTIEQEREQGLGVQIDLGNLGDSDVLSGQNMESPFAGIKLMFTRKDVRTFPEKHELIRKASRAPGTPVADLIMELTDTVDIHGDMTLVEGLLKRIAESLATDDQGKLDVKKFREEYKVFRAYAAERAQFSIASAVKRGVEQLIRGENISESELNKMHQVLFLHFKFAGPEAIYLKTLKELEARHDQIRDKIIQLPTYKEPLGTHVRLPQAF